jgi:hypothetical protein
VEGNLHSIFLTETQGTPDWRTLRNFVMTSTVYVELLSALKHVEIDDDVLKTALNNSSVLLNMCSMKPVVEEAPEKIQMFLSAILDGTINTTIKEWVKTEKYKGGTRPFPHLFSNAMSFASITCPIL